MLGSARLLMIFSLTSGLKELSSFALLHLLHTMLVLLLFMWINVPQTQNISGEEFLTKFCFFLFMAGGLLPAVLPAHTAQGLPVCSASHRMHELSLFIPRKKAENFSTTKFYIKKKSIPHGRYCRNEKLLRV
jgi:hypothetical protein